MSLSSQRPLKTYSHRRSRGRTTPVVELVPPRNINAQSGGIDEDIRVSQSMQTRSRQQDQLSIDVEELNAMQDYGDEEPSFLEMPRNQAVLSWSDRPDQINYETPYVSMPQDPSAICYATTPDNLSPVPASRRILSRVGSRNLKENLSEDDRRGLASPFHSRPGSRMASPDYSTQGPTKRPRLHIKSRTLSTDMDVSQMSIETAVTALQAKSQAPNHNRTASIPVMSSITVDGMDPDIWLIPPKALSRSPSGWLNDSQHEHTSFYFDAPAAVSTPARRSRANTSIYTDDNLDLDEEISLAHLQPLFAPKSTGRRRRKTKLQAPEDSLFSSMLDFSAYVTDEESPNNIRRSHGSSILLQGLSHASARHRTLAEESGLGSAFSPSTRPSGVVTSKPASPADACQPDELLSPEGKALSSLFSSIDISAEVPNMISEREDLTIASAPLPAPKPGHRRKRGDTIRASDFARPMVPNSSSEAPGSASTDNITEQSIPTAPSRNTRRMRSGTITLADVRETAAPASPGIIERIIPRAKPESSKHRRRRDAVPYFKRTIHAQALTPQGSDDSDDELLLTGVKSRLPAPENPV